MHQLDLLQTYLLVVNAAALAVGLLDWRARTRGIGVHAFVSIAFSLMGGGPATLVTSLLGGTHTKKDNVAQRFFAAWSTLAWGLVLANLYGWCRFDPEALHTVTQRDHTPLWAYLCVINVVTFILFCVDKGRARKGAWRIREGVLLGCSLAGGALGGFLGMAFAHHKVRTPYFALGIPLALALDIALVAHMLQAGIV